MSPDASARTCTALVSLGDTWLGSLGPYEAATPWWADVEPVTRHLDDVLGVPATVLRLVDVTGGHNPAGGHVRYHVEVVERPRRPVAWRALDPAEGARVLEPHPKRARYASRGGVAGDLAWATATLERLGRPVSGAPRQVKTWNLSCVHRIPIGADPRGDERQARDGRSAPEGHAWLKVVNPFQTAEAVAIGAVRSVDPTLAPRVLGADPTTGRTLTEAVPGTEHPGRGDPYAALVLTRWAAVQAALADPKHVAAMIANGIPDRSDDRLVERFVAGLVDRPVLDPTEHELARAMAATLPARVRRLGEAGMPTSLVHGDLAPLNWRADGASAAVFDWSDAALGHPAYDLGVLDQLSPESASAAAQAWDDVWRVAVPGCDPAAARALAEPLRFLRAALLYQHFLDHIEPAERRYHEGDPGAQIRLAAERWGGLG